MVIDDFVRLVKLFEVEIITTVTKNTQYSLRELLNLWTYTNNSVTNNFWLIYYSLKTSNNKE